jgi:hypothetical protein
MVGAPKHVQKALDQGVDIICAQGGEGGGHTGSTATSILIPACVDICKDKISPLTGKPVSISIERSGRPRLVFSEKQPRDSDESKNKADLIGECHCRWRYL